MVLPATSDAEIFSQAHNFRDGHVYMIANSTNPNGLGPNTQNMVMTAPEGSSNVKVGQASQTIHCYPGSDPYIIRNPDHGGYELFVFEQNEDLPQSTGWLRTYGNNWWGEDDSAWHFQYVFADENFNTYVSRWSQYNNVFPYRGGSWGYRDGCVYNVKDDGTNLWWMYYPNMDAAANNWQDYIFGLANKWNYVFAHSVYIYEKTYLDTVTSFSSKTGSAVVAGGQVSADSEIGVTLVLTRTDGKVSYVPVTLDMITGWPEGVSVTADGKVTGLKEGTYAGLGVEYEGTLLCGDLVLKVRDTEPAKLPLSTPTYYYRLTNTLVDGKDYIIVNTNKTGNARVLTYVGNNEVISADAVHAKVYLDADGVPCVRVGAGNCDDSKSALTFGYVGTSRDVTYGTFKAKYLSEGQYLDTWDAVNDHRPYTWNYTDKPVLDTSLSYDPYITKYGFCMSYWPSAGLGAYATECNDWRYLCFDTATNQFRSTIEADRDDSERIYLYERVEITALTCEIYGDTGMIEIQDQPGAKLPTGSYIKVQQPDGVEQYVEITTYMLDIPDDGISGLPADALTKQQRLSNLTVTYDGKVITDAYTLIITSTEAGVSKYPNPGAVRVDKKLNTSENAYFSTGVGRIDLSVTGVPMQQGVDLLLVVDTSSSMNNTADETGISRIQALRNAVGELITQLKLPNEDGTLPDIELGIVQFNDHTYFDTDDHLYGGSVFGYFNDENRSGVVQEFTNISTLNFNPDVITTKSGTNYDVGLQYAYNFLAEKKAANEAAGDDRKQVVVFMSDGICFQYNWLSSSAAGATGAAWESWLRGTSDELRCETSATYYEQLRADRGVAYAELFHPEGRNWIAEAIKGEAPAAGAAAPTTKVWDTDKDVIDGYYKVVFRENRVNPNTYDEPPVSLADSWRWVPGLGATIYSIGFGLSAENGVSEETGHYVLQMIASDPSMYANASDSAELHRAFRSIGQSLRTAGEDAIMMDMMDMMGVDFDLQLADVKDDEGDATGFKPSIQVSTYDLCKYGEIGEVVNGVTVTESVVGTRKSAIPSEILETVTFNATGTEAYSNVLSGNILNNGVICAKTFWYNTTGSAVNIDRDGDGTAETELPAETFCWNVGKITEQELVLSYYVYLTETTNAKGEGTDRAAGNYPTNEYATLTYTDHNGNTQAKETVSPILPWKQARVTYGFYLVDAEGNVVVNAADGTTGSFANKIALGKLTTLPMNLNDEDGITITASELTNLPAGYVLFDNQAAYNVHAHSGGGGSWTVTQGSYVPPTTYVAGYGGNPTLDLNSMNGLGYDYSHTTVWFAVMMVEDTVLLDKTVKTVDGKDDEFMLTLDAYTTNYDTTGDSLVLDETAILKDTLSDYFQLANGKASISVYTQRYLGNDQWGDLQPFADAKVTVTASDGGSRLDTIEVSGFNYSQEYVSENVRVQAIKDASGNTVTVSDYRGSKIVLKVHVKARDGFWGGNNVPTNESDAAIYCNGELLKKYPEPEVNVPVKPVIKPSDKVVYYGENKLDGMDLIESVTVGGKPVVYDPNTGKFFPGNTTSTEDDWMDDYADLTWNPNYSDPTSIPVSGTTSDDYTFGVILTPKPGQTGEENTKHEGEDYIAGEPIDSSGTPSDPATGHVDILVPVITFEDSTIDLGESTNKDYYEQTNREPTIERVNKDDPYGVNKLPTTPSAGFETEPDLSYTYSTQGSFTQDTPVNVEVHLGSTPTNDNKITNEVYFDWVNCDSTLHDNHEQIADDKTGDELHRHKGSTGSYEFFIHVTYTLQADTVVIDFGIPVDIDVTFNDVLPDGAVLTGVKFAGAANDTFGDSAASTHGTLTMQADGKLRYVPAGMKMNVSETFQYAVKVTATMTNANGQNESVDRYYYSTVTVIPATIIYYEDNFVNYFTETEQADGSYKREEGGWTTAGTTSTVLQQQDRPGAGLAAIDADNIYGSDANYTNMHEYSYGSSQMIKVRDGISGVTTFSFRGTGFDVISLSSDSTGTILVMVYDADANTDVPVVSYMVDTYYGYQFADGKWEVNPEASDTLYQVPVIKVNMEDVVKTADNKQTANVDETEYFGYGHYTVEIIAAYSDWFDHDQCECKASENCSGCYDFYLDAIRIYDPANDGAEDEVVEDAYIQDHEYKPTYEELRNHLITVETFDSLNSNDDIPGIIFIDGNEALNDSTATGVPGQIVDTNTKSAIADYANFGPNNELYLAPQQAVAFKLEDVAGIDKLHLALKSVGGSATATVYGVEGNNTVYALNKESINTATDLYYNITDLIGKTVVIRNSGDSGMLSITNLKTTYLPTANDNARSVLTISRFSAAEALASINEGAPAPVEPTDGAISLKYATATFKDEVKLNIFFDTELAVQPEDLGLITFSSKVAEGNLDNAESVISGAAVQSDGSYAISTNGIAAKNLGDAVWFRVYARLADGSVVYSKLVSYSPKAYAMNILSGNYSTEMKALVVAMLNYGAAAQTYFDHNTDALVNADLTADQLALVGSYREDLFAGIRKPEAAKLGSFAATEKGFTSKYPAVSFQGAFAISYFFTTVAAPDSAPVLYYWTEADYNAASELRADNATGVLTMTGAGEYSATVSGIAAKDMNRTVYVAAVYEAQGETFCSGVLAYSLGAYFAAQAAKDGSAMQPLAKAAAIYGSAAQAYFG